MKTVFVLLLLFLGIGLFAREYNNRTRVLVVTGIVGMLVYLSLT
jgi:hypothetical protein